MTEQALRHFLATYQFWMLEIQFGAVVVAALMSLRSAQHRLRPSLLAAVLVFTMAWILTATLPPRTNRIFYDEQIYQGVAHNMADRHVTEMCNEGQVEYGRLHCSRGEYNKEPAGFPYLIALAYRVAGVGDTWAPRLNNLAVAASALVAMGLTALLFESALASAIAGAVLMLLPMQITWGNTAAAEPMAALWCGAAMLAAVHFARVRSNPALGLTIAVTAFATTIRPESVLVAPLVALAVLILAPDEWKRHRLWWGAIGGLLLMLPTLAHLLAVRNDGWGAAGSRLSWAHAVNNVPVNFWFYFADERFPAMVGIAAVIGALSRDRIRERVLVLLYFFCFWAIFVFFYAGSYGYGANVRYSLMSSIPLSVLAGTGSERIALAVASSVSRRHATRAIWVVTAAVLAMQFSWYLPLVREVGEEAWAARADVSYARTFARALPPNSIVLTHNPSMFLLWGVNAGQMSIAANDPSYVRERLFSRYAGGVYVHWNFWCNVNDPVQRAFCYATLRLFPHDLVDSARQRDYLFAIYRLRNDR